MGLVDIFLFFVVSYSVLVFLIIDCLESPEEKRKTTCYRTRIDQSKTRIRPFVSKPAVGGSSGHQEDEKRVGADGEADEKQALFRNFKRAADFQELAKEEEVVITQNAVRSCEELDFGSRSPNNIGGNDIGDHNVVCQSTTNICVDEGEGGEEGFLDDWEGIERTELEKIFGEAVVFVGSNSNADQIGDVKLELYGLQKVALEGPCHGSQPMALKVSARSKWNAWQKLGNMSRETAMEKYVEILSKAIPGWKGEGALSVKDAATSEEVSSTWQNKLNMELKMKDELH